MKQAWCYVGLAIEPFSVLAVSPHRFRKDLQRITTRQLGMLG
jgi:hypothetical protein